MKQVITAQAMRAAEERCWQAQPGVDLMSRAASAVADAARELAGAGGVLVVVGAGNNGGDGLFAAAQLAETLPVSLWLTLGRAHEAGLRAARDAGADIVEETQARQLVREGAIVIDAFTGLGSRPGLPDDVRALADLCREQRATVVSVDLPSGLDTDSGAAHPSFNATRSVTFAALKPCHVLQPAATRCGEVRVADIGVKVDEGAIRRVELADIASWWPVPDGVSHKYTRGVVLLDTGSMQYPGAALLGLAGALHAGAGMARYVGPADAQLVLGRFPSVVLQSGRAQAAVIGSGWGEPQLARADAIAELGIPVVADAEALQCLPSGSLDAWLLTPHAGELAALLGVTREAVEQDPVESVREAARRTGATVLLKGGTQYVAETSGRVTIAVPGPGWTASAGSGDVLAGICGALLAAGLAPWRAGVVGASMQALAATRHPGPFPPDRLAELLPGVIAALTATA